MVFFPTFLGNPVYWSILESQNTNCLSLSLSLPPPFLWDPNVCLAISQQPLSNEPNDEVPNESAKLCLRRIAKPLSGKGKLTWLEAEWVTKKIGPRIFPFWWWPFYGTGQVASVPRPPHRARHNAKLGPIGTRPAGRCFSASLCWRLRGNSQGLSIHTLSKRAGGFIHWCSTMLERYAEKLGWYVDLP